MDCPICGSDDIEILNSKQKTTKKKLTEEYLLKCEDCGHVFKDIISLKKPRPYRLIISEQDKSHKTTIDLSSAFSKRSLLISFSILGKINLFKASSITSINSESYSSFLTYLLWI